MRIAVIGLGKVGLGLAACLRAAGHEVVGIDRSPARVGAIDRRDLVVEPGVRERLWDSPAGAPVRVTTDISAIAQTTLAFIVVPTPSEPDGRFALEEVLAACRDAGEAFRGAAGDGVIALVSTVLPGASRDAIIPALEAASGRRIGDRLHYAYNPAFVALGEVVDGFERPDLVLIGEASPHAGEVLERVHRSMLRGESAVVRLAPVEVEIAKLASNTHDACRVAFANMLLAACTQLPGANVDRVTSALAHRFGARFLRGAVPFGGPCWPRDNIALASVLDSLGVPSALPRAVARMNDDHGRYLLDVMLRRSAPGQRIGVLGLSYKPGTPLVDESFGVRLASWLSQEQRQVLVWDPIAADEARRVLGDSVRYAASAEDCLEQSDVVAIVLPLGQSLDWTRGRHLTVIDCWRSLSTAEAAHVREYVAPGRGPSDPSFATDRHVVLPKLIDGETLRFVHDHTVKKAATTVMHLHDRQVPDTPAIYGDAVMEGLMVHLQPIIERASGLRLHPTYAYARVYKRGDVLEPHRDREACELTVSLNLGTVPGQPWPLWIQNGNGDGETEGGVPVRLGPGDAVLFRGIERTHWRDRFEGERAVQIFLHYVDQDGPYREWKFDKRDSLSCERPADSPAPAVSTSTVSTSV